ncbi:hypothetical protein [Clostridium sp.]|uniref:hypothetical protein n=1 Tax=Clostridium sp. TaxID=1506 RepID=UPI00283B7A5A|nr:hypothetical protein [Clostridium sp.]MDR3597169.1 hypothetical protein [Clostridium sp.]
MEDIPEYENNVDNNSENGDYDDNFDDDSDIDDHANQDADIDESSKKQVQKEEEDNLMDTDQDINFGPQTTIYNNLKRKKTSGILKISLPEYSRTYGTLTKYIMEGKIDIPEEMKEEEEVKSGDAFRIARFWIFNRHKYPLPLTLGRELYQKVVEYVDINKLVLEDELEFNDDNSDSYKFFYNYRDKPYDNGA